jgi:S-adenosylmethionine/arginine decarboxylase-like enzyme
MTAYHLMVEGVVGTAHGVWELSDFIRWVVSPVAGIGMTVISGPDCLEAEGHLTAWAIIAESHIILNEFPDGRFMMDVFSCKDFLPSIPVDLAVGRLDLQPGYVMRILPRACVGEI